MTTDLPWPPGSREVMLAWQRAAGTDLQIAAVLGISRASVYGQRKRYGVPSLPRKKRDTREEPPVVRKMDEGAIARLHRGRSFADACPVAGDAR